MSEQPNTTAASNAAKAKAVDTSKALCRLSESPLTPTQIVSLGCAVKKLEKLRQDGLPDYLLRDKVQARFLESLKCGAFNGARWRDQPGEPHFSELLRYAKENGYVNWQSDEATYKGVIDEAAGQLIELLRQEAAAPKPEGQPASAENGTPSANSQFNNDDATLSPRQLAKQYEVSLGALKKRLERLRKKDHTCFTEVADRSSKQPQFLYRVGAVRPIIDDMKKKASCEASRKRPA